ncbi:MAG: EamA family transporter [Candidatus Lokiarchaeota archaeon]|nr:EamA family transporter [Candidatus Lokiarchaeota archaeon]
MKDSEKVSGYSIMIFAVFTWSFSEIIVKLLQGSVGPLSLSFFRFFIGGIFLFLILLFKKDLADLGKMLRNNWKLFIISSCIALGISNIIYFVGVTNTQANIAATIYTTYPIWITIYSFFLLNERSNVKLKAIGITIGLFGVIILLTNLNFLTLFKAENLLGNILVLIAAMTWSFYSVLGKKIQQNESELTNSPLKFAFLSNFLATIPVFVILLFTPEFDTFFNYSLDSWFWVFFLGIVSTGLGIYLLFEGLKRLEVSKGMSLALLKPIFATILAFLLLRELPTIVLIISIALVVISIALINRKPIVEPHL